MVYFIDLILPGSFNGFGIRPRSISGLSGIALSPFLHSGLPHLLANSVPLLVMGSFVSALAPSKFIQRTVALVLISGTLTWVISSSGIVIGASGLVFAYWSFLVANGVFKKKFKDVAIALITLFIYGALIFGLFRFQHGISWAGHFSGAVAGVLLAVFERK